MIYRIDQKIFDIIPTFCRGVVIAWDTNNTEHSNAELEGKFREQIFAVFTNPNISVKHPKIDAWQAVYKRLGIKDVQPSIAAMVRRIKSGKGNEIPFISPLVCISNLVSLTYLTPSGLIDADSVQGELAVGFANGTESFAPIGGQGEIKVPAGEVIYYDSATRNVMCRGLNSRGGKSTWIQSTTRRVVIDVDGLLDATSKDEMRLAVETVAQLVQSICQGNTEIHFLDRNNSKFTSERLAP